MVLEDPTDVKSAAEICREHVLKPRVLARWKAEFVQRAPNPGSADKERIADLERMVRPD